MKPLLIFDLDGTLVDSAHDIAEALNLTLKNNGRQPIPHAKIVEHIGDGLRKLLIDFFPEYQNDLVAEAQLEQEFLANYEEVMLNNTTIFPGVESFLTSWNGPLGIITNKNEAPAKILIQHLGLHRYPWVDIFGADTLAEKKPSPLPLRTMMKKANYLPAQTLMIGDGTPDILSAKAAGVKSVAIAFGYTSVETLRQLGATEVLPHYDQMYETLKKMGF